MEYAQILTKQELRFIERKIDEINLRADNLEPSSPWDAEALASDDLLLEQYISVLEKSFRRARIQECGFQVIS